MGLTAYEAKVFSALTSLGEASVGEIFAVAGVPRSAVYGVLEKLERRGVIETSTGRPKKFRALPPKLAVSRIESGVLDAVRDARTGLEALASTPHREASDVHIWIVRGKARVQDRLEDIAGSAKKELFVAGTPEHMLAFTDAWRKARARKVKVVFACMEPEKISELSKLGKIMNPRYHVKLQDDRPPRILFVRADRKTMLFASEYREGKDVEELTAFWTDDWALVRFLNYLTDALSPPVRKSRGGKA